MTPIAEARRGPITLGLMMATIMAVLDSTVVNVALPHMQGNLSASPDQITWVITGYIAATAVMTPVSGWLATRVGLKRMVLISVAGFTVASMMCAVAADLPQIVLFRILQGAAGAPIAPLCQAVLLNINPPERLGRATAVFMMGGVAAPVLGPVLGAVLTDAFSWRWCFFINVPAGVGAFVLLWIFLPNEAPRARRFDLLGFASLGLAVAAFQLVLDRGPSQDWFGSSEIWIEAVIAVIAIAVFLVHTATTDHPLFDARLVRDRNYVSTTSFSFVLMMVLTASTTLLPLMTQGVLGYPVLLSGMMSMPRGALMLVSLSVVGRLDAIVDRRAIVAAGLAICVVGFWRMTQFSLDMTSSSIVWAGMYQGIGQGLIFVPLTTLAFATIDPALRADASSLSNLVRNLSGSIGVAGMQALTTHNAQVMHVSLASHITAASPMVRTMFSPGAMFAGVPGLAAFNAEISRQAEMIAYLDDFKLMVILGLACAPLLLLLRQPKLKAVAVVVASEDLVEAPAEAVESRMAANY